MKFLRNLKIRSKLFIGFGIVLLFLLGVAVLGVLTVREMNTHYTNVLENSVDRYSSLHHMSTSLMDIRRVVALVALHSGQFNNLGTLEELQNEANVATDGVLQYLLKYQNNLRLDPDLEESERTYRLNISYQLGRVVEQYRSEIINGILVEAQRGQERISDAGGEEYLSLSDRLNIADYRSNSVNLILRGQGIMIQIEALYSDLMHLYSQDRTNIVEIMAETTSLTMLSMTGISFAAFVVCAGVALLINWLISKPVKTLVTALEDVSQGRLNVNLGNDSESMPNDEIGELSNSALSLVTTIKTLVRDMETMSIDQSSGKLDSFVDETKFQGAFADLADKINGLVRDELDIQKKIVDVFSKISNGDFDTQLQQMPGEMSYINEAVDSMRNNIKGVAESIDSVIEATSERGQMDFHIDTTMYYGGWFDIMEGLNRVCASVDEPITEVRDVMSKLRVGDFTHKITGDYPGDFGEIKDSVNGTIDSLNNYISEMSNMLSALASGNLTVNISRDYVGSFSEIKRSINNISKTLNKTMSEIHSATDQVLSGVRQISQSAMDLASGSQAQASSVQELNASIDLISQQTRSNAENAETANELSHKSTSNAKEGNEAMKQMLDAMLAIRDSSGSISRIIRVIQDIAFQTNLLSLNAAVEAARAGQHGLGFGVVAEEVRNLASRSQDAASETTELIQNSINRVESGSAIAETTAHCLNTIVKNANNIMNVINSISLASHEQADAIDQISHGLQQISNVVQSNSAVSEETAAAAQELSSQADLLQGLVAYFKL